MSKNRFQVSRGHWLTALVVLGVVGACGNTKTNFSDTDMVGSAGASGWTFLPPGSGGSGTSSGGSLGRAGAPGGVGTGGNVALPPVTFECRGKKPNQALITNFDGLLADRWISPSPGNLDGGVYVYPEALKPASGEVLRFADIVKDYTGMGVWFNGCIDGSTFRGVRFTISGEVGASGNVQFYVINSRNKEVDPPNLVGECVPADPSNTWDSCRPPVVTIPVTTLPTTHAVAWSSLKGGIPSDKTEGSDLLALQWSLNWDTGVAGYPAQLTVDNLEFYTGDSAQGGAGGAGAGGAGAGGAGAGGAGAGGAGAGGAPDVGGGGGAPAAPVSAGQGGQ